MKFYEGLKITKGVTAIVGGGGKSTLMNRLGEELSREGWVIICATTHIWRPDDMPVLTDASKEDVIKALKRHSLICAGEDDGPKLRAPGLGVEELSALADYVIAEADGARGLPLKAHREYEPVIPANARVIYVVGADGIGKPISIAAHRPELYAAGLGVEQSHIVAPEEAARMVDYGDTVLFNKAESAEDIQNGIAFAEAFKGRTVIASLKEGKIHRVIDN